MDQMIDEPARSKGTTSARRDQGARVASVHERDIPLPTNHIVLKLENVSKSFGPTRALVDVSLSFVRGEIHCVLGENGAGKSTVGKIIAGLHAPDTGALFLNGKHVQFQNPRQAKASGVALVYQELSLALDLSVRANLWLGSEGSCFPWATINKRREMARIQEVLAQLGIDVDVEEPVKNLPVGMQQLIEIGKSLMFGPHVVVFDEPTAMLGAIEKMKFFEVIRGLRDAGVACVLITHHIEDVMAVGDHVTVMRNGQCVDSFKLDEQVKSEVVLARLTGRAQPAAGAWATSGKPKRDEVLLEIDMSQQGQGLTNIKVHRGETVCFYGVVGCGAESLLRGIAGVERPARFQYRLRGIAYTPQRPVHALRAGVSYLPAGRAANGIMPTLSIRENLMLSQLRHVSRLGCVRKSEEVRRALDQLTTSAVKHAGMEEKITSLSGGNQQKVLVARAMAVASDLLILEEPTAGVDIEAKYQIHERVRAAAAAGLTVLVVSSDLPETLALCDTLYTMFSNTVVNCYHRPDESLQGEIVGDILGRHEVTL